DDCDEENGPLLAIPGSHKGPILEHNDNGHFLGATDIAEAGLDNSQAVSLPGKAGSITLHHVRTLHASRANTGDRARLLMLNSYKAADCWPILGVPDLDWYHGCLVRGETSWTPRMEPNPIRIPADLGQVGLFTSQEAVRGRSFGEDAVAAR
ncbi:MAG: phytanoyl-CoA dioxygenase family protein, partial [Rhodospirillaceae bacterium]|nr:phytanoyl-CoA dioxygenase family protein [Rhodospirillaceae bacterium]